MTRTKSRSVIKFPHDLNLDTTDCVKVQRSVISIVNWLVRDSSSFLTSLRVIVNHTQ